MSRALAGALWAHWRRAPLQLLALMAGLVLATALFIGVQAINAEARAAYDAASQTLGEADHPQLIARDGGPLPMQTFARLRRAGWLVSPVVEGRWNGLRLIGIDPLTAPSGLAPEAGAAALERFLAGPGVLYAAPAALAGLAETGLAETGLELRADPGVAPGVALTDLSVAQRLLGQPGAFSRLIVLDRQPLVQTPLAEVAPELRLRPAGGAGETARLTRSFHLNLAAFGWLAFATGIFIAHGAAGLAFEQRRGLVRTLRALGLPLRTLLFAMALELTVLALVAAALGLGLGLTIAAGLLPDVSATLGMIYGANLPTGLTPQPITVLAALLVSLGGTGLAGATGFWRIARMPVLGSAGAAGWAGAAGQGRRWQAAAALALLASAGGFALWGTSLPAAFALLAALNLGAALALPPLLSLALAGAARLARRPLAQWFWAETRQEMPGLSLALMALLLALSANVGVSTMVGSFRQTFVAFLDQRLAAEFYLDTASPAEAARLTDWAEAQGIEVLPLYREGREIMGRPGEVRGLSDAPTYRDNWHLLQAAPDAWARMLAGEGVFINEQLLHGAGLALGDAAPLGGGAVLGVVADYGNPLWGVVTSEASFAALFPEYRPTRFGLRVAPDRMLAVRAALSAEVGLPPGAITDQAAMKALSRATFERTFTVTAALNVLTLGTAALAMLFALLTLAERRLPMLAPLWALGTTRGTLARLEVLRALALAALTGLFAVPLGLVLAEALLARVNVAAFGWRLPMMLFPAAYVRLFGLCLLAALLAALWPALRLARTSPERLLKVFANAR